MIATVSVTVGLGISAIGIAPATAQAQPADPAREQLVRSLAPQATADLERRADPVPHWRAIGADGALLAAIGSSWEVAATTGYSGKPIDILVAVDAKGKISALRLAHHEEPILTLGLSDTDLERFTHQFVGLDLAAAAGPAIPAATIARATVTSGVLRDAILRTGRVLAASAGIIAGAGIDRLHFEETDWRGLRESGALAHASLSLADARAALAGAKVPPPEGEGSYIELFAAIVDPPTIGRSLLGEHRYQRALAEAGPHASILFIGSRGLVGHRGLDWRRSGVFDRIALIQGGQRFSPRREDFAAVERLVAPGAPKLEQMSLFRLPTDVIDPTRPFRIELRIDRKAAAGGTVGATLPLDYALPERFVLAPPPPPPAAWEDAWERRWPAVIGVVVMLSALFAILLFQNVLVRHKRAWITVRMAFLTVTFLWLGLWLGGQLSVVQVAAFLHALLGGFRWETFLIEPVIFTLWGFVALGMLFWGRGVYCGWLCPFGALQEVTNFAAQRLGVRQIAVPHAVHERLWLIKYTLFVGLIALSFYSMEKALILAEAEPFKTAITLRLWRAWPFVAYVVALLVAGLFIERFYCRYLCVLGAGLAIPAKLKIFDWLDRRPQCGRECRLCEQKCTVGAIDPLGRINPNECVLCLRCQVIYHDPKTCIVLKRRQRTAAAPAGGTKG